ncbi:MAG TPA: Uma2 family endonuclease [Cyanobacteria bacterium UBA11049]|nr:Uma2 family endonuclease [Cyanobacteria bacterium UBA11049]
MTAITLDLNSVIKLTQEQFYQLCQENRDVRLERDAQGRIIVMPPTGWGTGERNAEIIYQLRAWSRQNLSGIAFDSSTGFILPNGANRSPDAAWVRRDRIEAIDPDPDKFLPLAADFVIELRSSSDRLEQLPAKMQEYIENGVRLGWLIDPKNKLVEIYRSNRSVDVLRSPTTLSGEDVLPGFVLDLEGIF